MESPAVQNGPNSMFLKDYSLLVMFDAYLGSECTTPDGDGAGLVAVLFLRTALGLLKEEERR